MGLEAQDVAVRVRYLGGTRFRKEAEENARDVERIGSAAKKANGESAAAGNAGMLGFLNSGSKQFLDKGKALDKLGSQIQNVGRAALPVSAGLGVIGYMALKTSVSVGQSFKLLETQAFASRSEVKELEKDVKGLAYTFGTTPQEIATALYPLQSSFKNVKQDVEGLQAALMGAKIGLDSLPNTANAVAGGMKANMKDIHSATEMMAVMDYIVGSGKLRLPELTESLTTGILQQASQMGVSFRDIGALDAALAKSTVPPNVENTRLRLILTKLGAASSKQEIGALRSIGLNQYSLAQDIEKHDLLFTLRDLESHLQKFPKDVQNVKLAEMFGQSRGFATISGALEKLGEAEKIRTTLGTASSKSLTEHFKQSTETEAFRLAQLKGAYYETMTELGRSLSPTVIPMLNDLGHDLTFIVKTFSELPKPVRDAAAAGMIFGFAFGPVAYTLGGIFRVAGGLMTLFGWLGDHVLFSTAEAASAETIGLTVGEIAKSTIVAGGTLAILYFLLTSKAPKWIEEVFHLEKHSIGHEFLSAIGITPPKAGFSNEEKRVRELEKDFKPATHPPRPGSNWKARGFHSEADAIRVDSESGEQGVMRSMHKTLREALQVNVFLDKRKIAEAVHEHDREHMARR